MSQFSAKLTLPSGWTNLETAMIAKGYEGRGDLSLVDVLNETSNLVYVHMASVGPDGISVPGSGPTVTLPDGSTPAVVGADGYPIAVSGAPSRQFYLPQRSERHPIHLAHVWLFNSHTGDVDIKAMILGGDG